MTPNQIVSHNLRRAREHWGWTQEETAERLTSVSGQEWSTESYAQAERAAAGKRVRRFDADELHAFCRMFRQPLAFFLVPPSPERVHAAHQLPAEGEPAVDFFARVIALDDLEAAWILQFMDGLPPDERRRLQLALAERALQASEDAIAEELGALTEWEEPLRSLADQLKRVRRTAHVRGKGHRLEESLERALGTAKKEALPRERS
jgi:transcriptional regulator with XRE-family HTH domain